MEARRVIEDWVTKRGTIVPRPEFHHEKLGVRGHPRARYLIVRQGDLWFIKFAGEDYGPYKTEREAMLLAINAAQKLGEQGEETQVLLSGDNGKALEVWSYGQHPFRC
jgi:hypothetical protein